MTEEQIKLIHRGINAVWNEIAYDCLQEVEGGTMPKDEVIEVCLDADRLYEGRPHGHDRVEWNALVKSFYGLSMEEQNKIAAGFSKYERFGI